MHKFLKIVGGLLAVLLLAIIILFFTDFNAPWLSKWLVETLSRQAGVEMSVDSASINFLRGIKLTGVDATKERRKSTTTASMDLLLLEHRLWPLLWGDIVVHRIELDKPVIEVVSSPGRPQDDPEDPAAEDAEEDEREEIEKPPSTDETKQRDSVIDIGALIVTDAELVLRTEGVETEDVVLRGLSLELTDVFYDTAIDDDSGDIAAIGGVNQGVGNID